MWVENKVAGKPSKSKEDVLMLVEISLSKKVARGFMIEKKVKSIIFRIEPRQNFPNTIHCGAKF